MLRKIFKFILVIMILLFSGIVINSIYKFRTNNPDQWMKERIHKDLESLKETLHGKKITMDIFNKMFEAHPQGDLAYENQLAHFQIIDGKVYGRTNSSVEIWKFKALTKFMKHLAKTRHIKNTEFIICYSDICDQLLTFPKDLPAAPVFVNAKNPALIHKNKQLILLPDVFTLKYWPNLFEKIRTQSRSIQWKDKIKKAVWRGGANISVVKEGKRGAFFTSKEYECFPRIKLQRLSKNYPDKIDADFVGGNDKNEKKYLSQADHLLYKYLPVLDGVTVSYPGLLWRLASNSVTFKQESPEIQWYYDIIKANVHYVPIARDMTDLVKKIDYALMHDQEMQEISENARRLVKNVLTVEKIEDYCAEALNTYTEFLGYEPKPTLPLLESVFKNLVYLNWVKTAFCRLMQNF